jgi:WD40 repeat protein
MIFQEERPETAAMALDAQKFVATFWTVITESAPHIYLSALPFAYGQSIMADHYHGKFGNTLLVNAGAQILTRVQKTLEGHKSGVRTVAFSPDGVHIVSGSADRTLKLWHKEEDGTATQTFEGHSDWVMSASFSPDGKHIASGSCDKTIRIWDIKTGKTVHGPFKGHTDYVISVSFSSDGKSIVSSSGDKTINVWNVATGKIITGPIKGHTDWVSSVLFMPNSQHIVSGSHDHTIRVWDVKQGNTVGLPVLLYLLMVNISCQAQLIRQ